MWTAKTYKKILITLNCDNETGVLPSRRALAPRGDWMYTDHMDLDTENNYYLEAYHNKMSLNI